MNVKRPAIEIAADWFAAACLGAAVAFATRVLTGTLVVQAAGIGLAVAATALFLVGKVDAGGALGTASFVPVDWAEEGDEALLLDEQVDDEELLLDDTVAALPDTARVVRLFDVAPASGGATYGMLPPPGEMVARIEDFLGSDNARGRAAAAEPAPPAGARPAKASDEASAALHAALADIRRSLRRG